MQYNVIWNANENLMANVINCRERNNIKCKKKEKLYDIKN